MNRRIVASVVAFVALAGCNQGPESVLGTTASNLDGINSGVLTMKLLASSDEEGPATQTGFTIEGPFTLPGEDELPVTEIEYTQIAGETSTTTGFLSTEDTAYVVVDEQPYELAPEQVESLRGSGEDAGEVFETTDFDSWIEDPKVSDGPEVDGVPTERVSGELDVPTALDDIFEVARMFGADEQAFPALDEQDAQHIRSAVESATLVLVTGAEDRFLRDLDIRIRFDVQHHEELAEILGSLAGVEFTFDLSLADVNDAVLIEPPDNALPITELPAAEAG